MKETLKMLENQCNELDELLNLQEPKFPETSALSFLNPLAYEAQLAEKLSEPPFETIVH